MKHGNIFLFDLIYYGNKNRKKFLLPPLFAILSYYVMAVVCKKNQILDAQAAGNWDASLVKPGFYDWWYYLFAGLEGKISSACLLAGGKSVPADTGFRIYQLCKKRNGTYGNDKM